MLHKAWNNKGEVPYCFPRSSIKFQGHTGLNITDFDPNWAFPVYRPVAAFKSLRFALFNQVNCNWFKDREPNLEMSCSNLTTWQGIRIAGLVMTVGRRTPFSSRCSRSSIKFQAHTGLNITDFDPNWAFPDYRPVAAFKSLRFALFNQVSCNWFKDREPNLEMSCSNLTTWQGIRIAGLVMAVGRRTPFSSRCSGVHLLVHTRQRLVSLFFAIVVWWRALKVKHNPWIHTYNHIWKQSKAVHSHIYSPDWNGIWEIYVWHLVSLCVYSVLMRRFFADKNYFCAEIILYIMYMIHLEICKQSNQIVFNALSLN